MYIISILHWSPGLLINFNRGRKVMYNQTRTLRLQLICNSTQSICKLIKYCNKAISMVFPQLHIWLKIVVLNFKLGAQYCAIPLQCFNQLMLKIDFLVSFCCRSFTFPSLLSGSYIRMWEGLLLMGCSCIRTCIRTNA